MNFLDTSPKNLVLHGFAWLASLVLLLLLVRTRHELVSVEESQSEKISQLEDILSQLHERFANIHLFVGQPTTRKCWLFFSIKP